MLNVYNSPRSVFFIASQHSIVLGKNKQICYHNILNKNDGNIKYPFDNEQELLAMVKKSDLDATKAMLQHFFKQITISEDESNEYSSYFSFALVINFSWANTF